MRAAFIGHYYHKSTRSNQFFIESVLNNCTVEYFWDETWLGKSPEPLAKAVMAGRFDLIVVWQSEQVAQLLARMARDTPGANIVFVPMWDGCQTLGAEYWRSLAGLRVVSFCRRLHERVTRHGLFSHSVQYFPDPAGFPDVAERSEAAAFLWWRVPEIGWPQLRRLLGDWRPDRLHLHVAPDPQVDAAALPLPTPEEVAAFRITTSTWFEDAAAFRQVLSGSTIFVAPRMSEGIGMAMLEAMAAGMCVVAHDAPTMNEYIVSGVNGLLADMTRPAPLDLTRHRDMGRRARDFVAAGHAAWLADLDRLREFVLAPPATLQRDRFNALALRDATARAPAAAAPANPPRVTVATVVRNNAEALAETMRNVARQDYPNLEYIVVDGASTDTTTEVLRANEAVVTRWISEPDLGPFDAMNKAAALATGDYIIFMNAGDWFAGPDAVSRAFRAVPGDADVVIGNHIYRVGDDDEQLHRVADFDATWDRMANRPVDAGWLQGIPGHQATFTRTALLRTHRYDCRYRIAADHEFLYRMKKGGARFFHSLETVSVYTAGGLSARQRLRLFDEWLELAERYGGKDAMTYLRRLRADALAEARVPPSERVRRGDVAGMPRQQAFDALESEVERLQEEIDRMRRSASWMVTYPLRWAMRRAGPLRALWSRVPLPGRGSGSRP